LQQRSLTFFLIFLFCGVDYLTSVNKTSSLQFHTKVPCACIKTRYRRLVPFGVLKGMVFLGFPFEMSANVTNNNVKKEEDER
jgi:hypothetical protein